MIINHNLATITQHDTGFSVSYGGSGEKYTVCIVQSHKDKVSDIRVKTYETADKAQTAFMRITECVLSNFYSFEDRAKML
ncbi:hypothetical protein FACS189499_06660 [Clostridia bacterium]|nr:hypothetical protein FACS189499_06660 [Clostridia bacterium]